MNNSKNELQDIINLVETLEDQKKDLAERIKEAYSNAESKGFDPKAIKEVIKAKKGDVEQYKHNQDIVSHYLDILTD
jgi:uncharacterized protein (UPF0335 family)